jgi:acyl carrier protein
VSSWPTLPPIGRPTVYNTRVYILDQFQQLVPVGVAGELYADSDCLARGYLHRPELTAERFIPNPFTPDFSGHLYKTHDRGRYLPDGNIEFLGRTDHQVKVRGFRIELGEVEAVLAKHPAVRECAVVPREDGSGHKRLVAYVVPAPGQADNTLSAILRAYLKEELPDYMVPAAIAILDPMPLTPSGKVDRRALPAPDATAQRLNKEVVLPRTPMEERIGRIWAEALGLAQADINTTFFEQGGHSLLAVKVLAVLRETFQMDLSLSIFSKRDTIAALADYIDALKRVQDSALTDSQIEYVEGEL